MNGERSAKAASGGAFHDRREAGRALAERLRAELPPQWPPATILGLPRGGVPVAYEIATVLKAPLDVLVARKIGAPSNPELGVGALAEGGIKVLGEQTIRRLLIDEVQLEQAIARARRQLVRDVRRYRAARPPLPLQERTAVLVDDGLATGVTARAALESARARGAARVVLAAPVGAPETVRALAAAADSDADSGPDAIVCLLQPRPLWAIGMWYEDFTQVSSAQVTELLARSAAQLSGGERQQSA